MQIITASKDGGITTIRAQNRFKKEKPVVVKVSKDGLRVDIETTLEMNRVYKFNLDAISAMDGSKMSNTRAWYTLNRLKG